MSTPIKQLSALKAGSRYELLGTDGKINNPLSVIREGIMPVVLFQVEEEEKSDLFVPMIQFYGWLDWDPTGPDPYNATECAQRTELAMSELMIVGKGPEPIVHPDTPRTPTAALIGNWIHDAGFQLNDETHVVANCAFYLLD